MSPHELLTPITWGCTIASDTGTNRCPKEEGKMKHRKEWEEAPVSFEDACGRIEYIQGKPVWVSIGGLVEDWKIQEYKERGDRS